MKKLLSLTVLGLSLFTLAACGKSSSKTETKGSLDNEPQRILTVKHGNVRQNFDKIYHGKCFSGFFRRLKS